MFGKSHRQGLPQTGANRQGGRENAPGAPLMAVASVEISLAGPNNSDA
jgi:hypothetical protein